MINSKLKLILHFDINGTITNYDSTENPNHQQMVNMILSKNSFGKILNDQWILNEHPLIEDAESITYYDYLKLVNIHQYKQISFLFTQENQPGQSLKDYHSQMLENKNLLCIFPSFIKVMNNYSDAKIIFRTFGNDGNLILDQLKNKYGYHKEFIKGQIQRTDCGPILQLETGEKYFGIGEINQLINLSKFNLMLKEDYKYWSLNNRNRLGGKVFIIDDNYHQLFFDDNDCVVCYDIKGNLIKDCEHLIKINTISAQLDENYYVRHIENCCNK